MDGLSGDQCAKVASVFGDENEVVLSAALQHLAVRRAQAAKVARMHGYMVSFGVERSGNGGRDTLVEKQLHGFAETTSQFA